MLRNMVFLWNECVGGSLCDGEESVCVAGTAATVMAEISTIRGHRLAAFLGPGSCWGLDARQNARHHSSRFGAMYCRIVAASPAPCSRCRIVLHRYRHHTMQHGGELKLYSCVDVGFHAWDSSTRLGKDSEAHMLSEARWAYGRTTWRTRLRATARSQCSQ
jgi:hypothetical protein